MHDQSFASASTRWWARAAQFLGWAPDTFWTCTPMELISALTTTSLDQSGALTPDELANLIENERNE